MLPPVRCISCGRPLGDKAVLYRIIRRKMAANALGDDADPRNPTLVGMPGVPVQFSMGEILDRLGVTTSHCRATLLTNMELIDHF